MKNSVARGVWKNIGVVSLLVWLAAGARVEAQVLKVLDYTNTFRYNEADNLDTPANAWTAREYADNTGNWLGGPGLLGYETTPAVIPEPILTTLQSPVTYTPAGHAVYFRAHFNNPFGSTAFLTLSNQIDDGAVFYLNGVEIQRIRVAAGQPTFTSRATQIAATEGLYEVFTILATNLVNDDNVLAAIVLQNSTASLDTVYGTTMWAEGVAPVAITNQPVSVVAQINDAVSFAAAAIGWRPAYQWQYRADTNVAFVNLTGATNAVHAILAVGTTNAGDFRVIVSNALNTVTSSVAVLTVLADVAPPQLVWAEFSESTNAIVVAFDETVVVSSATNVNNFAITVAGGTTQLEVTNAAVNGRLVQLRVTPRWTDGTDYILTVNHVTDAHSNAIPPDSKIGIAAWRDVLPLDQAWNWSDAGVDLGSGWTLPDYNESTNALWALANPAFFPVTRALFYASFGSLPGPKNTAITIGWPAYYFRTRFVLPPGTQSRGALRFNHVIDDGAVFYLNGQEVYRYNMPVGPVSFGSLAATAVSNPTLITTTNLSVTNLVAGANVLAVETHVSSTNTYTDATVVFGTALRAAYAPTPDAVARPRLAVRRDASGTLVLSWEGSGFVLQSAPTPLGAWTSLPQASSPHTNTVAEAQQYFRLKE